MLLNFLRHSLPDDILEGFVDIHSHILPGVDDGFPDKEKSLRALHYYERKGVAAVVLTPHFMIEYPNTKESITNAFGKFLDEAGDKLSMKLFLGGEYMLDSGFDARNQEGFLTIGTSKKVLCETSYLMSYPMAGQMLYNAALNGYEPIIAHPERYVYATSEDYKRWKSFDYQFQLNLLSFSGAYGGIAVERAITLLNDDMYDYVGTDIHNFDHFIHHLKHMKLKTKQIDKIKKLMENNRLLIK